MKKILALTTLGLSLIGCNVMESPTSSNNIEASSGVNRTKYAKPGVTCTPSCVINDLQTWDLATGLDSTKYLGLVGDTLRTYLYRLEDGREGDLQKSEYDTLKVGNILPNCRVEEAVGACPEY